MINNIYRDVGIKQCAKHGEYQAYALRGHVFGCPTCAAEQAAERDALREMNEAAERERNRIDANVKASGIPPRFLSCSLDGFRADTPEQLHAKEFARDYAESFSDVLSAGRCALFAGNPGTGKTHLACAIALRVIHAGYSAKYMSVMRAVRSLRDTWQPDAEQTTEEVLAELTRPALLILDEVGVQSGTESERLLLFDIINARYEQILPTILVSNFANDKVREFIGDRAFDRLREGAGQSIPFNWGSHRGFSNTEAAARSKGVAE